MSKKYKCARYLRLSQEDIKKGKQVDESSSISSQRMIIDSFAKYKQLEIVKEYVDDGYSGGNFDRPGFKQLINDIEKGLVNCVITKDLSRLGREIYTTGTYIEEYFLEHNVRYIAINDSYDSEVGDNMLGLRLGVNDLYLRDVSKKVKSSLRTKQEAGDYIGTYTKYGLKKDPKDHHKLIIDEEVAPIVKRIFEMALDGLKPYKIADILTSEQIPIPIVYKKEKRGLSVTENNGCGIWRHQTIKDILTSEMYIGNMVQHTYQKVSYRSKKTRKIKNDELIIVEGTHEAIINKEDFFEVQKLLKETSKFTRGKEEKYLFTGLLKCKECGHSISISEKKLKKNNSHYTQCNLYRKKGKYGHCTQHRLNYNLLEDDLLFIIKEVCSNFLNNYDSSNLIEKVNEIKHTNTLDLENKLEKTEKEIVKLENLLDSLYMDKFNGVIDEETFGKLFSKQKENLKNLNNRKTEQQNKLQELNDSVSILNFEKCKNEVLKFMSMKKPTHTQISRLVKEVKISEDKKIQIHFNFKELTLVTD